MTVRITLISLVAISLVFMAGCDVEKQMDTMIDNPSFAEPLFTKFMARGDYQAKAIDTILSDPAMRQQLMEQLAANGEYARAAVEQLMSNPDTREMMGQLLMNQPGATQTP